MINESEIGYGLVGKLTDLKHIPRSDIRDRKALEHNFRKKFDALNRVTLGDSEFARLRDEIITPDVFQATKNLRQRNDDSWQSACRAKKITAHSYAAGCIIV